jgi:hypothetical protein
MGAGPGMGNARPGGGGDDVLGTVGTAKARRGATAARRAFAAPAAAACPARQGRPAPKIMRKTYCCSRHSRASVVSVRRTQERTTASPRSPAAEDTTLSRWTAPVRIRSGARRENGTVVPGSLPGNAGQVPQLNPPHGPGSPPGERRRGQGPLDHGLGQRPLTAQHGVRVPGGLRRTATDASPRHTPQDARQRYAATTGAHGRQWPGASPRRSGGRLQSVKLPVRLRSGPRLPNSTWTRTR